MEQPVFQRNTQQKINRLLRFFTRDEAGGFLVAVADDQRAISAINREVIASAQQKGRKIVLLFLDTQKDVSLLEQFRRVATPEVQGIIVGNLDSIFPKSAQITATPEYDWLTELNFGREALHRLDKPLLFWVSPSNFGLLQRRASDLFTQRASSTVFFDIAEEATEQQFSGLEGVTASVFRSSVLSEAETQSSLDKVSLLLKQLKQAEKNKQLRRRTANDVALPLAKELAELDDPKAIDLLEEYYDDFDVEDVGTLAQRGKIYLSLHQFDVAELLLRQAVGIAEKLPPDLTHTDALLYLGDLLTTTGRLPEALSVYEQNATILKDLEDTQQQYVGVKERIGIAYSRLGETHEARGNLEKSLTFFEKDLKLSKELYNSYPQNVEYKNGLAISYSKLGSTQKVLGNLEKALSFFEQYNHLEKELHDAYPQNVEYKNGLAISYLKLGDTHKVLGNLEKALSFFEEDLKLSKELHDSYPQNVKYKNSLAISYLKLGWLLEKDMKKEIEAKVYYQQSKKLLDELVQSYPAYIEFKKNLDLMNEVLSKEKKQRKYGIFDWFLNFWRRK